MHIHQTARILNKLHAHAIDHSYRLTQQLYCRCNPSPNCQRLGFQKGEAFLIQGKTIYISNPLSFRLKGHPSSCRTTSPQLLTAQEELRCTFRRCTCTPPRRHWLLRRDESQSIEGKDHPREKSHKVAVFGKWLTASVLSFWDLSVVVGVGDVPAVVPCMGICMCMQIAQSDPQFYIWGGRIGFLLSKIVLPLPQSIQTIK